MKSSGLKLTITEAIALAMLLLSLGLWIFFCWTEINEQFPFAIAMEFWPYFLVIPALGLGLRLSNRRLRQQRSRTEFSDPDASGERSALSLLVGTPLLWTASRRIASDVLQRLG